MSLKLNVSMIIISFLCMINSQILHVSIDIVIQFSNVEMYKDFLLLDTSYGYLFIILYYGLLVALAKKFCYLITYFINIIRNFYLNSILKTSWSCYLTINIFLISSTSIVIWILGIYFQQVEKVMQHRELEQKLADAKLEQANAYLAEEQERSRKEHAVVRSITSIIVTLQYCNSEREA